MRRPLAKPSALAVVILTLAAIWAVPSPARAISGNRPLAVVLCKFTDQQAEPHDAAYYEDMFSQSGAGKKGVFDYWKDVSYGNLDLTGTVVKGWYTADKTAAEFNVLDRVSQIDVCASKADPDIAFEDFAGVVVLTNHTNLNGPLFGGAPPTRIGGKTYPALGRMAAEEDQALSGILHETGHSFGLDHSRKLSTSTSDYNDMYDVMSCFRCYRTPNYSYQGDGGPGLNAVMLDVAQWLPPNRVTTFDNSQCRQQTYTVAALNHPEAGGPLELRIPASVTIPNAADASGQTTSTTTSDYYTVELRSKSAWDQGIPQDVFVLHLKGKDNISYWVDAAGGMTAGRVYADAAQKAYVAVNSIDPTPASTGVVTLGSCKINAKLAYSGPTSGDYHDQLTLTADLTVEPGAPIPYAPVTLSLGTQSCFSSTDASGRASCQIILDQVPGTYSVEASYAGNLVYNAQTTSKTFTINKRKTVVQYTGPSKVTNGSAVTFQATLAENDGAQIEGQPVSFTLGAGATAQTCGGNTDPAGIARCEISRVLQPAGQTAMRVAFEGNDFYVASNVNSTVEALKGKASVGYRGPSHIANDFPATFQATLTQEARSLPLENRTVTFTLGSGSSAQTCSGTTDADGHVQCTIPNVAQPGTATSVGVQVAFAGDDFFFPAGASTTVKVLSYAGRSYGLSAKIALLPPSVVSDTGEVSTAAKSVNEKSAASVSLGIVSSSALSASVTTGAGASTGKATTGAVTIGAPGLPVIRATNVRATSQSTCQVGPFTATATGAVTVESLTIGGIAQPVTTVGPNSVIRVGTATITLNEQKPVPGSSAGLLVNAIHVSAPGIADVVVSAARSDVHNCPRPTLASAATGTSHPAGRSI
ncbi:choice-of-anchor P family protein [Nonomuraea sp. CA-141351]|uniref:choice-of-anchor P family protein n=1 Tax=Nonomuraea sp. CA-141351 TaxID=3239996 RepID=UPI003D8A4515